MLFKVRTVLMNKINGNSSIVSFEKEIGAANEEQACRFAKEAIIPFVSEDVIINTEIVED